MNRSEVSAVTAENYCYIHTLLHETRFQVKYPKHCNLEDTVYIIDWIHLTQEIE